MGLARKREMDDAQRRYTANWKKSPTGGGKPVSHRRTKREWKTLRDMSRNEYQAGSQSRPLSTATKKLLVRPVTDVQGAAEDKLANVVVARAGSRAQSTSLDQAAMSAVVMSKLECK